MNSRQEIFEEDRNCCLALSKIGVRVNSVYELSNHNCNHADIVPILLELLQTVNTPNIKEGIIGALGIKNARGSAETALIEELLNLPNAGPLSRLKWTIGNTLYELGTIDAHFDAIAAITVEPSHGTGRQMLVMLLGKSKRHKERAEKIAFGLLEDQDVQGHAIRALGNLRSFQSIEAIEQFLSSSNEWHRREANTALKKIRKAQSALSEDASQ